MLPQEPRKDINPPTPTDDGDVYGVSAPVSSSVQSELAAEYMAKAARRAVSEAPELPPRPRWPMFSGVFTFPFYLTTLGPWLYISMGLLVTAMLLMFWLGPGMVLGLSSARLIGLPTCAAALLTFSYAAACCLTIIEDTFNGWDVVEEWPDLEWKEWVWSFTCMVTLTLQALLVGLIVKLAFGGTLPWLFAIGTLIAFPFIVLGSLGAEAWVPMAIGRVLLSLRRLWWAWALFYLETTPLIVGWFILSAVGLVRLLPFTVPFYSAPLLAFVVLVYARLLGRLARLIREKE